MKTTNTNIVTAGGLTGVLLLLVGAYLGSGCNGDDRVLDDIVTLSLNFQICTDASTFSDRSPSIRWEGHLREANPGATTGETSFSIPYAPRSPLPDSPAGRSWFRTSVDNLRAGDWDLEVEYIVDSVGGDDHDRLNLLGATSVYSTRENADFSKVEFPACP